MFPSLIILLLSFDFVARSGRMASEKTRKSVNGRKDPFLELGPPWKKLGPLLEEGRVSLTLQTQNLNLSRSGALAGRTRGRPCGPAGRRSRGRCG